MSNLPSKRMGILLVLKYSSSYLQQFYINYDEHFIFSRWSNSGGSSWQDWFPLSSYKQTWNPIFPRDTASNVTAYAVLTGNLLTISCQWENVHVSGQGNSYIRRDSFPTPNHCTIVSGFHGSWHYDNGDAGGECGQGTPTSSFWFTKAGQHLALPTGSIGFTASAIVSF